MNPFLRRAVAFAEALAAGDADGTFSEDVRELFVTGRFTAETANGFAAIAQELTTAGLAAVTVINNRDEPVAMGAIAGTTGVVRIRIAKPCTDSTVYFFTLAGLQRFLARAIGVGDARTVLVADDFEAFATDTTVFRPWEGPVEDVAAPRGDEEIDASRVVYGRGEAVPKRVGPLLVRGELPSASPVSNAWALHALRALPVLLADEVQISDQARRVLTIVLPRTSIEQVYANAVDRELLRLENEAAGWIYASAATMDTRHALFASELGRMWHDGEPWDVGFRRVGARALESAKSAERLLASGKTSDVLKAEGDLRKALNDEVSRVNQQIRDLTGALWRDFAVAIGALVARATLATAGNSAGAYGAAVLIGASLFLVVSVGVVVYANRRLLTIAREARGTWQSDVYAFLTEPQVESLALKPIRNAEGVYYGVEGVVIGVYVLVIGAMLIVGFGVNGQAMVSAPFPSPSP